MRLVDYFAGRRLSLAVRLSPAEVEGRINAAAASIWLPGARGTIGWARSGMLRLRYRRSQGFSSDASPVLVGRIRPSGSGSRIDLHYRPPWPTYAFFSLWYIIILAAFVFSILVSEPAPGIGASDQLFIWSIFLIMLIVPLGLPYFGTVGAEANFDELIAFLGRETGAQPVAAPRDLIR